MRGSPDDLTGRKFGYFVVLEREPSTDRYPKERGAYWRVQCVCGKQRVALASALRGCRHSSCGCTRASTNTIPLTGKSFGRLTVTGPDTKHVGGDDLHWNVRCECGTEKTVDGRNLRGGKVISCGCARVGKGMIDLSSRRFGKLTVEGRIQVPKGSAVRWAARCDCGAKITAVGQALREGRKTSCGCDREAPKAPKEKKPRVDAEERRRRANRIQTERAKVRYRTETRYALNRRMRDLMNVSLKRRGGTKSAKWEILVGYTVENLERHLIKMMPAGYTWKDFLEGRLHIDHIIPLSAFNFFGPAHMDFKHAWSLKNLQLLPEKENLRKGARLTRPFQPALAL